MTEFHRVLSTAVGQPIVDYVDGEVWSAVHEEVGDLVENPVTRRLRAVDTFTNRAVYEFAEPGAA